MTAQFIKENGQAAYVVLPVAEYEDLLDRLELAEDIATIKEANANPGEWWPADVVNRLLDGDNPIKVYREHRGLTQGELAKQASLAQATIAQMETGARVGTVAVLKKIAAALAVDLDDLVL